MSSLLRRERGNMDSNYDGETSERKESGIEETGEEEGEKSSKN